MVLVYFARVLEAAIFYTHHNSFLSLGVPAIAFVTVLLGLFTWYDTGYISYSPELVLEPACPVTTDQTFGDELLITTMPGIFYCLLLIR